MVARAVSARHWRFLTSIPSPLAIRSIVRNPRLCGVNWYSIPGLPKPTISFTQIRSSLFAFRSVPQVRARPFGANLGSWLRVRSQQLFFLFLLGLLSLFGFGLGLGIALSLAFTLDFLLALLDDFGFRRRRGRIGCHCLGSRHHFF